MHRHLYQLKKMCVASNRNVDLTEEIKECILENRRYLPKETDQPTVMHTINNNQTINNYIANLDTFAKLKELTSYKNKPIKDFETKVEDMYEREALCFKTDSVGGEIKYDQGHFMEMIHEVTCVQKRDFDDMCVVYNKDEDRIYMSVGSGKWDDFHRERGAMYLVETIASYCLEHYEVFLIRKLESGEQNYRERIEEYYRFISIFGVRPFVQGKADVQIMYNDDDPEYDDDVDEHDADAHVIADRYQRLYAKIRDNTTSLQKRTTVKSVLDVIKATSKTNIRELNKRIMTILNMDDGFKESMLKLC